MRGHRVLYDLIDIRKSDEAAAESGEVELAWVCATEAAHCGAEAVGGGQALDGLRRLFAALAFLFGEDSLVVQGDLKSAFDALSSGSARYVAADAVIGTYVAFSNGDNDKIVALLQDPTGYCAAVDASNTELQGAISSAMNKLVSGGMMSIIEEKWLGTTLNLNSITVVKAPVAENSAAAAAPAEGEGEEGEGGEAAEGEEAPAAAEGEGEAAGQ